MRLTHLFVLMSAVLLSCAACSGTAPTTASTIASMSISGAPPAVGGRSQYSADVTLPNGVEQNVTNVATWQSSDTAVASVSSTGLVTGVAAGSATLTATYQGVSVSQKITI